MISDISNNLIINNNNGGKIKDCFAAILQNNLNLIVLIIIFSFYLFLALYFSIHHVYLEWDEIILRIAGRKYLDEPGNELFFGEKGLFKAPLFSLLLGLSGSNDFLVVAVAGVLNFVLVGVLFLHLLDGVEGKSGYFLLGLTIFAVSYQIHYYFIVFYAETLSITFILFSIIIYIQKRSPLLLALICFFAFLTRVNLVIMFIFFPFCYYISNKSFRFILTFVSFSLFLMAVYFSIEYILFKNFAKTFVVMFNKVQGDNPWIIENNLLSYSFYFIALLDLLGLFNGIIFYLAGMLVLWKKIVKHEVPDLIHLSFTFILLFIASLTLISAKSDRFLLPILPLVIIVNIWALSVVAGGLTNLLRVGSCSAYQNIVSGVVSIVLILSSLGYFSVFKYNSLLSRKSFCFSEPREFSSPRERFFLRTDSERTRLVHQYKIAHYLNSAADDLVIFTDLAYHYVYANFGHKIVSVKTKEMEKPDMAIERIDPTDIPKGSFFLGRHDFPGSRLLGRIDSIESVIIN